MISSAGTCFLSVEVKEHVILMPSYIGQIKKGIFHKLNQRILEYSPDVQGVIVAYSKPVILQSTAAILEDDPQIHFDVKYCACVFQPPVGTVFNAFVNRVGDGYLNCLVCGCFSVIVGENTNYHIFTEGQEIRIKITKLPKLGENVSLTGELYYAEENSKQKKKRKKQKESKEDKNTVNVEEVRTVPPAKRIKVDVNKQKHKNKKSKI